MRIYKKNDKCNIIGERVRQKRLEIGLSQSELASKLQTNDINIEQKSISRIENGSRFVADFELLELSKILKVTVEWLLTGEGAFKS